MLFVAVLQRNEWMAEVLESKPYSYLHFYCQNFTNALKVSVWRKTEKVYFFDKKVFSITDFTRVLAQLFLRRAQVEGGHKCGQDQSEITLSRKISCFISEMICFILFFLNNFVFPHSFLLFLVLF